MGVEQMEVRFKNSQHDAVALAEIESERTPHKTRCAAKLVGLVKKRLAQFRCGEASVEDHPDLAGLLFAELAATH